MKPFWDRLMEEFESSPTALIADVDCTTPEGEELCMKHGIEGYPTLKYGDPNNLQDYEGEREYDDLLAFAKENLGPTCGPKDLDLCDEEQKATIAALIATGYEELEARLDKINEGIKAAEENFENEVQKLQDTYEGLMDDMQKATNDLKGDDYNLFHSVYKHLKPEEEYSEPDDFGEGFEYPEGGYDADADEYPTDEYPGEGYDEDGFPTDEHDGSMPEEYDESMPEGYDETIEEHYDDSTAKEHGDL